MTNNIIIASKNTPRVLPQGGNNALKATRSDKKCFYFSGDLVPFFSFLLMPEVLNIKVPPARMMLMAAML
ncbi:MAG: hypothetical protein V3U19_07655 [Thermodesulfobacteriota bacterium]